EGFKFYKEAVKQAEHFDDNFFLCLLDVVKALYIEPTAGRKGILQAFEPLRNGRGYPYIEELAFDAAEFYTKEERAEDSVFFF
ncbi:hypothetical protein, partial [Paraburkholderia sp. SIMBA_027]|uniref:hypothetical protein n=1 Tax=Paraburkholderia sp. SIMBA_027 TaxID=3085770 RepID=UPI00397B09F7